MKRLVLSFVLILLTLTAGGQYRFSDTSNLWHGMLATYGPEIREVGAAASYAGDTVIHDTVYRIMNGIQVLGIREDSAAGRIFCRFLTPKFESNETDASEHILFDYNLRVGDTFRVSYGSFRTAHRVQTISTVQFNGVRHRVWFMQVLKVQGSSPMARAYYFIEGIGPTALPHFSICPTGFEHKYQLLCFRTRRTRAHCTPPVGMFDNDESCSYPVGIAQPEPVTAVCVTPNPGGSDMMLSAGDNFQGSLYVWDALGRALVRDLPVEPGRPVPVGRMITIPGEYFYRLVNKDVDERLAGSFFYH